MVSARCMVTVIKTIVFLFFSQNGILKHGKTPRHLPPETPEIPSHPNLGHDESRLNTEVMDRMSHSTTMNLLIQSIEGWGSWETNMEN